MKLLHKQNLELQKQHVKELLEIEKSRESDTAIIEDLQSREEMLQETVNTLTIKERSANDELEEARKVAVEVSPFISIRNPLVAANLDLDYLSCSQA